MLRILQLNLHFHPYKFQVAQQLYARGYGLIIPFSKQALVLNELQRGFIDCLIMPDEAHFYVFSQVNKQNMGGGGMKILVIFMKKQHIAQWLMFGVQVLLFQFMVSNLF